MRRLHLVGFPHTRLDDDRYLTCAYTQKIAKFVRMGWGDRLAVYHGSPTVEPNVLAPPEWPKEKAWRSFNAKVIRKLRRDADPGDFLLLAGGWDQKEIADQMSETLMPVEYGVGYEALTGHHAAFESNTHRHYMYAKKGWADGRPFDTVIPNYFDPDDFPHVLDEPGDFLLFVGRVVRRKGPHIAAEIAERVGLPLVVAGPGPTGWGDGWIDAPEIRVEGNVKYAGVLDQDDRARLMASAAAVIVPTLYLEPFGGVAVEAMMCGTPVVASDWGAFVETVEEDVTGYRFSTIGEGVAAVDAAVRLPRRAVRERAEERFSLTAVKRLYERWFDRLDTLWGDGYYADRRAMIGAHG